MTACSTVGRPTHELKVSSITRPFATSITGIDADRATTAVTEMHATAGSYLHTSTYVVDVMGGASRELDVASVVLDSAVAHSQLD